MAIKTFSSNTTLTASDVNTYLTNAGLVYVTEASATSGTTLTIDSCFTSTYDAYRIVVSDYRTTAASTGNTTMVLRASGTDSTSNYAYGYAHQALFNSTSLTVGGTQSGSNWDLILQPDTTAIGTVIDLINPNLAQYTTITSSGVVGAKSTALGLRIVSGLHAASSAYDGFKMTTVGTIANIKVRVYGYRQS